MMLTRMGSLNALEQAKGNRFWRRWLSRALPSADTIGRVFSQIVLASICSLLRHLYSRLKRNKVLKKIHEFHVRESCGIADKRKNGLTNEIYKGKFMCIAKYSRVI